MEGTAEPDTARCIDIATAAALRRMLLPGLIAVATPPLVGFGILCQRFRNSPHLRFPFRFRMFPCYRSLQHFHFYL
jgi:hypothetical protein